MKSAAVCVEKGEQCGSMSCCDKGDVVAGKAGQQCIRTF